MANFITKVNHFVATFILFSCNLLATEIKFVATIPCYFETSRTIESLTSEDLQVDAAQCRGLRDQKYRINPDKRGTFSFDFVSEVGIVEQAFAFTRLIQLFKDDSYVTDSQKQFETNTTMILLLNRYRSLSSVINSSLVELAIPMQGENVFVLRGFWEPIWVKVEGSGSAEKKTPAEFDEILTYFKNLIHKNLGDALAFIKTEETKICRSMIPYRELRDSLLQWAYDKIIPGLVSDMHVSAIYFSIHDNDILSLNGVYTHYQETIRINFPDILSTGYQTAHENHTTNEIIDAVNGIEGKKAKKKFEILFKTRPSIKEALDAFASSKEMTDQNYAKIFEKFKKENKERTFEELSGDITRDMQTRETLASIDGRLIYWPEPNMLVKIFQRSSQKSFSQYRFVDTENTTYTDPHESSVLLASLYSSCPEHRFVFNATKPIFLRFNESFMMNKKLLQASYFFRNSSKTAIRQLPIESKLANKFVSIFSNLCGYYSNAEFLDVEITEEDTTGTMLEKMSSGMNTKFKINPQVNFALLAKKLSTSRLALEEEEEDDGEEAIEDA